jgi:hypothetical protein
MKNQMKEYEAHKHYWWGENRQLYPEQHSIIKLNDPRLFIKYNVGDDAFADYTEFVNHIVDIQWLDGKPSTTEQSDILIEAWNFLSIEERILGQDLSIIDNEVY